MGTRRKARLHGVRLWDRLAARHVCRPGTYRSYFEGYERRNKQPDRLGSRPTSVLGRLMRVDRVLL